MTPEELKKVTKRSDKNYYVYDQYGNNPMQTIAPVALVALKGARDLSMEVNHALVTRRKDYLTEAMPEKISPGFLREDFHVPVNTFRFSSGEGKAVIERTIRGHDLYIL